MKKFALLLVACVILVFYTCSAFAFKSDTVLEKVDVNIAIDGQEIRLDGQPLAYKGNILVPAGQVFEKLGAEVAWDEGKKTVDIMSGDTTITMRIGFMGVKVNGKAVKTNAPAMLYQNVLILPVRFVAENLGFDVNWNGKKKTVYIGEYDGGDDKESPEKGIVVIDAGHGGKDPGAIYGGVKEKDINLDVAKRLCELLEKENVRVHMTRTSDTYVSLYDRSAIANKLKADLFVSIHHNSGSSKYSGTMTLYYPGKGNFTGKDLALIVQKELTEKLGTKNLGIVSRPNLVVLRTTKMPAVIAEIGYMSNSEELKKLKSPSFRQDAAEALKNAVLKALDKIK